jgi:mono/diheme cytochrome c family protein
MAAKDGEELASIRERPTLDPVFTVMGRSLEAVMKVDISSNFLIAAIGAIAFTVPASMMIAQDTHFHNAPASSSQVKNPYAGQPTAAAAGARFYATNCGSCHGIKGRGTGSIPPLSEGPTQSASDGEVFWFITTGAADSGMPAWGTLPERQRWQIVTYLKSLKGPA